MKIFPCDPKTAYFMFAHTLEVRGVKLRPHISNGRQFVLGADVFRSKTSETFPEQSWPRILSSRSRSTPKVKSWRSRQGAKAALLRSLELLWAQHVSFTCVLIQNCLTFTFCWVEEKTKEWWTQNIMYYKLNIKNTFLPKDSFFFFFF